MLNNRLVLTNRPSSGSNIDVQITKLDYRGKSAITKSEVNGTGTFLLETNVPIPPVSEWPTGSVLVQVAYISLDPAMRGWLSTARSYLPPVQIGQVMRAGAVGRIVAVSAQVSKKFKVGDWVEGTFGWQTLALVNASDCTLLEWVNNAPPQLALSVLGMTGFTAYFGLFDVGRPRPGDTVVVSGAAGATGSLVGQLAKLSGCRVIGFAGGKEKCDLAVKEFGYDLCIDRRLPPAEVLKQLAKATPNHIDIFFDNVGGLLLDMALSRLARGARVVICGAVSQYNKAIEVLPANQTDESRLARGPAAYPSIIAQRATMQGFIVFDYAAHYPEARRRLAQWVAQGQIKYKDHIVQGLLQAPKALSQLLSSSDSHVGKMMVQILDSDRSTPSKL